MSVSGYNYRNFSRIETKLGVRVDIDEGYQLVQGQCHLVKGQGQINDLVKNLFWLYIMNHLSDLIRT